MVPTMEKVEEMAQQFRLEQARLAVEAEGTMGHAEARVTAIEHELRMYTHDILKPHHDKDYRALAVFPLEQLEAFRVVVLRVVDYKGDYVPEIARAALEGGPTRGVGDDLERAHDAAQAAQPGRAHGATGPVRHLHWDFGTFGTNVTINLELRQGCLHADIVSP